MYIFNIYLYNFMVIFRHHLTTSIYTCETAWVIMKLDVPLQRGHLHFICNTVKYVFVVTDCVYITSGQNVPTVHTEAVEIVEFRCKKVPKR